MTIFHLCLKRFNQSCHFTSLHFIFITCATIFPSNFNYFSVFTMKKFHTFYAVLSEWTAWSFYNHETRWHSYKNDDDIKRSRYFIYDIIVQTREIAFTFYQQIRKSLVMKFSCQCAFRRNDVIQLDDETLHKQIGNVQGNMKHGIISNRTSSNHVEP